MFYIVTLLLLSIKIVMCVNISIYYLAKLPLTFIIHERYDPTSKLRLSMKY